MKTCVTCGGKFKTYLMFEGKKRILKNRTKCTVCLPFNPVRTPRTEEEAKEAKTSWRQERYQKKCKEVGGEIIGLRAVARKRYVLNLLGGSCLVCGYSKCDRNLVFHHLDPTGKEMDTASRAFLRRPKKIAYELMKCVLLCANCHGEVHSGLIRVELDPKIKLALEPLLHVDAWSDLIPGPLETMTLSL